MIILNKSCLQNVKRVIISCYLKSCTVPYRNLYDKYSTDQSGQVNIYVVQKNKWKHFENKFQLTIIQNIPNHKLKILKASSQKIQICPPNLRYVYHRTQI
jgi:hypothetical protein